jgi:hypothetical protein
MKLLLGTIGTTRKKNDGRTKTIALQIKCNKTTKRQADKQIARRQMANWYMENCGNK